METAFELAIVAVLNMRTADWASQFLAVRLSIALSIISLVLLCVLPIWLTIFYNKHFSKLKQKDFREKYDSGIEGTKIDVKTPSKSILAHPSIFFARRTLFAVSAVYLGQFIWSQQAIQMTTTLVVAGFLLHA